MDPAAPLGLGVLDSALLIARATPNPVPLKAVREDFGGQSLSRAGGAEESKGRDGVRGVLDPGVENIERTNDFANGAILPDQSFLKEFFEHQSGGRALLGRDDFLSHWSPPNRERP